MLEKPLLASYHDTPEQHYSEKSVRDPRIAAKDDLNYWNYRYFVSIAATWKAQQTIFSRNDRKAKKERKKDSPMVCSRNGQRGNEDYKKDCNVYKRISTHGYYSYSITLIP